MSDADLHRENTALKAENLELKLQIRDLREELRDTQAALVEAVVNAYRRREASDARVLEAPRPLLERSSVTVFTTPPTSGPSSRVGMGQQSVNQLATPQPSGSSLKRPRTPSSERPKTSASPPKKAKKSGVIKSNSASFQTRRSTSVYVDIPPLKTPSTRYRQFQIQDYLKPSTPLEIIPPPLNLQVPRKFLWLTYGGNEHHFFQYISEDMNPSGPFKRRLVFPNLECNPLMPTRPGAPGLLYTPKHEILSNGPWTLFGKLSSQTSQTVWEYLGEYTAVICGKMTPSQFASQSTKVKRGWAESLTKRTIPKPGRLMQTRIALRKEGLNPDSNEALVQARVKADQNKNITKDDVVTAFSRGDELMDIIRVTCVGYDHVFANDMEAKLPNFQTLLAATLQKKLQVASISRTPPTSISIARSSPDVESEDEESEQEHDEESDHEHDSEQNHDEPAHKHEHSPKQETNEEDSENSEESDELTSTTSARESPPPERSPKRPRVASQNVLRRIEEGLIQDFGVENSDSDYVEG